MVGVKQVEVTGEATRPTSKIWQQGPRILIIAEDPDYGDWVQDEFQANGCAVALSTTGREAIDLLRSGLVDVVLSEMGMSDLPGMDLLREVGAMNRKPKVILTTSRPSEFLAKRAIENGATAVLCKPFQIEELFKLVKNALLGN
jgi:DNA-binding response OmpR family regulator